MQENQQSACPAVVSDIVLDILYRAASSIREAGYCGEVAYCTLEADHIHNLPSLLFDYKKEKLRFYLEVERPCYLERLQELPKCTVPDHEHWWPPRYEEHWQCLEKYLLADSDQQLGTYAQEILYLQR